MNDGGLCREFGKLTLELRILRLLNEVGILPQPVDRNALMCLIG